MKLYEKYLGENIETTKKGFLNKLSSLKKSIKKEKDNKRKKALEKQAVDIEKILKLNKDVENKSIDDIVKIVKASDIPDDFKFNFLRTHLEGGISQLKKEKEDINYTSSSSKGKFKDIDKKLKELERELKRVKMRMI